MLFDRSTHRVKLTDAGRALLPEARATLAAAQAARDAVDAARGGLRGRSCSARCRPRGCERSTSPGCSPRSAPSTRPSRSSFATPAARSQWRPRSWKDVLTSRSSGYPAMPLPGLELIPITSEPIMLAAPANHPLAKRRSVALAALPRAKPLVDLPAGWGTRMAVDRSFAAAGVTRTITYEVNDTTTMVELIRNKLAVGMLPASFVDTTDDIALHTNPRPPTTVPNSDRDPGKPPPQRLPPKPCSTPSNVTPEYEEQTVTADTITAGVRRRDSFRHPMPASRRACQHPSNRRCPTLGIRGGVALSASSLAAGRSGQSRSQQGRELAAPMSPFQHS